MAFDTRELFARLLKCESGGEGVEGMRAVASVIINRSTVPNGEFARIATAEMCGQLLNSQISLPA